MRSQLRNVRGVMLDPARLIEKPIVYREMIPLLGQWGYNLLLWHFIDDQGCAMQFPRRPEIASKHALTQRQTRNLVRHANQHGMTVIPEVECFGHTGRIVAMPKYRHLRDGAGKMFGAMCAFHPDARSLLTDLLADTAETFEASPFIHVGMDEVGFGSHPLSRKLLKKRKKWELFADHVTWLHETCARLGKRMMMWADHLANAPKNSKHLDTEALSEKILSRIPRDIVLCDWHYWPKPSTEALDQFLDAGFEVLFCPSTSAYGMINHPSMWNLDNLRDANAIARARKRRGVIGTINTVWAPWRWFAGVTLYGLAYGAQMAKSGKLPRDFATRFAQDTFGMPSRAARDVGRAIELLHRLSPRLPQFNALVEGGEIDAKLQAARDDITNIRNTLQSLRRRVTGHRRFYDDVLFAAVTLDDLLNGDPAARRQLHRQALKRWNESRYSDDPRRQGRHKDIGYHDALLPRLAAAGRARRG